MAYPYTATTGGLSQPLTQLRSAFPNEVNADTLKRWTIAPNNESYIINVLRFIGVLEDDGKKNSDAAKVFNEHDDAQFASSFAILVERAYADLFELYKERAWTLSVDKLIGFFRNSDQTSALVGKRQAQTFRTLAAHAGYPIAPVESKVSVGPRPNKPAKKGATRAKPADPRGSPASEEPPPLGSPLTTPTLTVRVEINLPVTDDQAVYDKIFRSIRANLINESPVESD